MTRARVPARAPRNVTARPVIGAVERVSIPAWGIVGLPARVDTGARTSALHVESLTELGNGRVRFELRPAKRKLAPIEAVISRRARVRSTSGKVATRLFVTARLRLGTFEQRIELGLVDRSDMTYRMLLGRSALAGHFLIDPGRRFVLDRRVGEP
jgi:hypothetical protein